MQPSCGKGRRERLWAKTSIAPGPFRFVHHLQRPKTAHVVVDEYGTRAQSKTYGGVGRPRRVPGPYEAVKVPPREGFRAAFI